MRYLYWADRRVQNMIEDHGHGRNIGKIDITSPSLGGMAPQVAISLNSDYDSKNKKVEILAKILGERLVSGFATFPVEYAQGRGTVVFSEFVTASGTSQDRAVIFSEVLDPHAGRVAVCLFGSMGNFADVIIESAQNGSWGWTSSAAPAVFRFLEDGCAVQDGEKHPTGYSREQLAYFALQVAYSQGMTGGDEKRYLPWRRSFTYGDVQDIAEWGAEVYLDLEVPPGKEDSWDDFNRVIIGAPLWVRTPKLRALRIYSEYATSEIEKSLYPPEQDRKKRHRLWRILKQK